MIKQILFINNLNFENPILFLIDFSKEKKKINRKKRINKGIILKFEKRKERKLKKL